MSMGTQTAAPVREDNRVLAFSLGSERYAMPLLRVREVIAMAKPTPVPNAPAHFKGLLNLRGQIISVIDLRAKFRLPEIEPTAETTIVILDLGEFQLGMIVDKVDSVLQLDTNDMSSPELGGMTKADYIKGIARVDGKLIVVLNIEKALDSEDLSALRSAAPPRLTAVA